MRERRDAYHILREYEETMRNKRVRISTRAWKALLQYLKKSEVPEEVLGFVSEEVNRQLREIYEAVGEIARGVQHIVDVKYKNEKLEVSVRPIPKYHIIWETGEIVDMQTGEIVDKLTEEQLRDFSVVEYENGSKNNQTI
ncbi:MAG: hypothetical protein QW451_02800 [Candidatus Aenigmatarchaeota archaeon]